MNAVTHVYVFSSLWTDKCLDILEGTHYFNILYLANVDTLNWHLNENRFDIILVRQVISDV